METMMQIIEFLGKIIIEIIVRLLFEFLFDLILKPLSFLMGKIIPAAKNGAKDK